MTTYRQISQTTDATAMLNWKTQTDPDQWFSASGGHEWSDNIRPTFDGQYNLTMPPPVYTKSPLVLLTVSPIQVFARDDGLFLSYTRGTAPMWALIGTPDRSRPHQLTLHIADNSIVQVFLDGELSPASFTYGKPVIKVDPQPSVSVNWFFVSAESYTLTQRAGFSSGNGARGIDALARILGGMCVAAGAAMVVLSLMRSCRRPARLTPESRSIVRSAAWVVGASAIVSLLMVLSTPQAALPGGAMATPRNWPFFTPAFRFSDFFEIDAISRDGDPYTHMQSWYPPFGNAVLGVFSFLLSPRGAFIAFLGVSLGVIFGLCWWTVRTYSIRDAIPFAVVVAGAFPIWFGVDRGNTDLLMCGLAVLGATVLVYRGNAVMGSMLIGLSGFAKIWPGFLALPWLRV